MDPTVLFTHLKIILLQYFQFSIFNFNNNKLNPNGPMLQYQRSESDGEKKNSSIRESDRQVRS